MTDRDAAVLERDLDVFALATSPRGRMVGSRDELHAGLEEVGVRRAVADALATDARADMIDWIHAGRQRGMGPTEIARLVGITRAAVYQALAFLREYDQVKLTRAVGDTPAGTVGTIVDLSGDVAYVEVGEGATGEVLSVRVDALRPT